MKRFLLCLLMLCSLGAMAQDVIVRKDGSKIECRVQKVSKTKVTYKRWTEIEGLTYSLALSEISTIKYENGETLELEEETTEPSPIAQNNNGQQQMDDAALLDLYKNNSQPIKYTAKSKRLKTIGWIAGGVMFAGGSVLTALGIVEGDGISEDCWPLFGPGLVLMAGGIATTTTCLIRSHKLKKQASEYSVSSAPLYQYEFHLKNGASLSPSLDILKDNTQRNATLGIGLTYNF